MVIITASTLQQLGFHSVCEAVFGAGEVPLCLSVLTMPYHVTQLGSMSMKKWELLAFVLCSAR